MKSARSDYVQPFSAIFGLGVARDYSIHCLVCHLNLQRFRALQNVLEWLMIG